jgi:hypothetical protein
MTTINWLMLFEEVIVVYSENHTQPRNTLCGCNAELLNVKASGIKSYHWDLKGKAETSFYYIHASQDVDNAAITGF